MHEGDARLHQVVRDFRLGRNVDTNFETLFQEFYGPVIRFFRRKNLSREEAEELAQEVFLVVYTGLKDLRDERMFRSWLFSVARNRFANYLIHLHAQKRELVRAIVPDTGSRDQLQTEVPDTSPNALAFVLEKEKLDRLHSALGMLPEQMRRCVAMRVVEDFKYEEIAQQMGIAVNTVKAHLHRARKVLNEKLSPYFGPINL